MPVWAFLLIILGEHLHDQLKYSKRNGLYVMVLMFFAKYNIALDLCALIFNETSWKGFWKIR